MEKDLLKTVLILAAETVIGFLFDYVGFTEANIITVYIFGVLVIAVWTSRQAYGSCAAIVSVLVFNYFFTEPRYTLRAYDSGYPVTFVIMFAAAFMTGTLAHKIKRQAKQSDLAAYRTNVLLNTNKLLQKERDIKGIIHVTARQLMKLLNKPVIFYQAENGVLGEARVFLPSNAEFQEGECLSENEYAVAQWVYQNRTMAGCGTGTLPDARAMYLAMKGAKGVYGVAGIVLDREVPDEFTRNLILSMLGECGLALEKEISDREREESLAQAKNEELRANLLRAISHDLRTPLTSISGNASVLLNSAKTLGEEKKEQIYEDIYEDSIWLIGLVENLLSITRLEDGRIQMQQETQPIDEVIAEAVSRLGRRGDSHTIRVEDTEEVLLARMDGRLIVQVVVNLLDNAVKYTEEGSEIVIRTRQEGNMIVTEVADNGPGIRKEEQDKIFEMFYTGDGRGPADSRRSMGLGLALCRSVIHAHGGEITVRSNVPRGTVFSFTLKAEEVALYE